MGCKNSKVRQEDFSEVLSPLESSHSDSVGEEEHEQERRDDAPRLESKGSTALEPEVNTTPVPTKSLGDRTSTGAPKSGPAAPAQSQLQHMELDDEGNALVLPNGEWVRTEGTPFYYSDAENLYFHPPSCQFYDPTNEMWYDPEEDEWYRDDDNAV